MFSLLNVDPLAGMEPAVREVAQTRMFAERVLFVTQKMPTLLRWQTELLSVNAVEMPAVQQLISNSTQLSVSVERFAYVAERLPEQLSKEREEIVKALQTQERDIASLMGQGTQFSASLNTTFTTFDALMKRFGVGEPKSEETPPANAVPFRIQDYTQSAAQIEATAGRLTELLGMLDRTMGSFNLAQLSAQAGPVVQQAQAGGKEVVDYAFWKGILLVVIVLVAALIYRFLVTRLLLREKPRLTSYERLTSDAEFRTMNFLRENPQAKWGRHVYSAATFGLNAPTIEKQFRFYTERFNMASKSSEVTSSK